MNEINQLIGKLVKKHQLDEKKKKEDKRQSRRNEKRMVNEVKPIDTILRRAYKLTGFGISFGIYEYDYRYALTYEGLDERQKKANFYIYKREDSPIWGFLHKKIRVYEDWNTHKDKILPALEKFLQEEQTKE